MRNVIELRRPLGFVPIEDIKLNAKSRDDTSALPVGIQTIYRDDALRNELFALLDKHILPDSRRDTARPGMDLWALLMMGVLKQGLRCDSFVVDTNVHHPTDFNLLRDSIRCLIRETARAYGEFRVSGWRQWKYRRSNVEALYRRVNKSQKWKARSDDVRAYLSASCKIADKAQASLAALRADGDLSIPHT